MKKCTPLWREAHLQVKMHKTHQCRTTVGRCDVEKVHAVVARSTFASQNVQSTPMSDHFWTLRCRKSACRCGAKHICNSKCTKHTSSGPLLNVAMSKKYTPLWREAHFEVKMYRTPGVRTTFGGSDVEFRKSARRCGAKHVSKSKCTKHQGFGPLLAVQMLLRFTRLHYITLHYAALHYITLLYISQHYRLQLQLHNYSPLHSTTLHYTKLHYTTLHYTTLHYISLPYITLHYTPLRYSTLHYTTLHSTTLHYTTTTTTQLHFTTLYYTTTTQLHSMTLHYTPVHYNYNYTTTLHYTTLHYTPLHYTTNTTTPAQLHSTTLHYTKLHYTTLPYTTLHSTYITLRYTPQHYN